MKLYRFKRLQTSNSFFSLPVAWGSFHARYARPTRPWGKIGTTRSTRDKIFTDRQRGGSSFSFSHARDLADVFEKIEKKNKTTSVYRLLLGRL